MKSSTPTGFQPDNLKSTIYTTPIYRYVITTKLVSLMKVAQEIHNKLNSASRYFEQPPWNAIIINNNAIQAWKKSKYFRTAQILVLKTLINQQKNNLMLKVPTYYIAYQIPNVDLGITLQHQTICTESVFEIIFGE